MFVKKEKIGWSVLGRHYRLNSGVTAVLMRIADIIGYSCMFMRRASFPLSPRNIAVIQLDHTGDMLLAGCFIANLKKAYPKAIITVIGRQMCREAADLIPEIDTFTKCNVPWLARNDSMGWPAFVLFLRSNYKHYDVAFDLHGDPRNNLMAGIIGKRSVGFGFRGLGFFLSRQADWSRIFSKHIIDMQCKLLETCGIVSDKQNCGITIPSDSICKVRKILSDRGIPENRFILFQMSSGRKIKDWPLENWKQLAKLLTEKGHTVVTADKNSTAVSAIRESARTDRFLDMSLDLAGYAALVSLCGRVVSVDTFTVHIAKALDKPVTAIYSGTNITSEWGPYNHGPKDAVFQDTSCQLFPCAIMHDCPFGKPSPCMIRIGVDLVDESCREIS